VPCSDAQSACPVFLWCEIDGTNQSAQSFSTESWYAPTIYAGKFILSWPFVCHSLNGIRHLVSVLPASALRVPARWTLRHVHACRVARSVEGVAAALRRSKAARPRCCGRAAALAWAQPIPCICACLPR